MDAVRIAAEPAAAQARGVTTSRPADPCEVRADRAAEAVVTGLPARPEPIRAAPPPADPVRGVPPGDPGRLARATGLSGAGQPLDDGTRASMESGFGYRFADVRIHADGRAGAAAIERQARAFTVGRDIVFAPGAYAPGTADGRRLLAHELAHVAQGPAGPDIRRQAAPAAPTWITEESARQLTDAELDRHLQAVLDFERTLGTDTPDRQTAAANVAILEKEAGRRGYPSPVLAREVVVRGAADLVVKVRNTLQIHNGLFQPVKGTGLLSGILPASRGVPDTLRALFGGYGPVQAAWITAAATNAGAVAQAVSGADGKAAFEAIGRVGPAFTAAAIAERLLVAWVDAVRLADEVAHKAPDYDLRDLLQWLVEVRALMNKPFTELSSLDGGRIAATATALPVVSEQFAKLQRKLVDDVQRDQRVTLAANLIVLALNLGTGLRSLFAAGIGGGPTAAAVATGGVVIRAGQVALVGGAISPVAWAEVIRKLVALGLVNVPVAVPAAQAAMAAKAVGGLTPGSATPGSGTPGSGGPGGGGAGAGSVGAGVPRPQVTGGARADTAGTGGIRRIDRAFDQSTGEAATTIEGVLRPTLPQRANLEKWLPSLQGYDRAHLAGRILGDEAAAGVAYARPAVNRSIQLRVESALRSVERELRTSGTEVGYKLFNRTYGRDVLGGRALAEARYEFTVRFADGRVGRTLRIDVSVARPGTKITPNNPGYTISAPFEGP